MFFLVKAKQKFFKMLKITNYQFLDCETKKSFV